MNRFYNLIGEYTNSRIKSYDLTEVIRDTPTLTFNPYRTSGFDEIDVILPPFLSNPPSDFYAPLDLLKQGFLGRLQQLPNNKEIWMGLSAGKDTRILLKILCQFHQNHYFDVDRIHFFSYEPEHIYARAILKECGFSQENLYIYREDRVREPDYYRLAEPTFNPNGNFCPEIEYFEPDFNYKDKVMIWGSGGNELTVYPSCPIHGRPLTNNLAQFLHYTYWLRAQHYEKYHKWGEIIEPYFYMPYMDSIFHLPSESFVEFDGIRDYMLRELGGTKIPCVVGHNYNYNFSPATIKRIHTQFIESQFAKTFDIIPFEGQIRYFIGDLKKARTIEMNVLGLAMTYEHAMRGKNHE